MGDLYGLHLNAPQSSVVKTTSADSSFSEITFNKDLGASSGRRQFKTYRTSLGESSSVVVDDEDSTTLNASNLKAWLNISLPSEFAISTATSLASNTDTS